MSPSDRFADARARQDPRFVMGANCIWWDHISKVSRGRGGLPCCPHCGGVLFEYSNEREWFGPVDRYEEEGHPGYRKFIEWLRGKCFKDQGTAVAAYRAQGGEVSI